MGTISSKGASYPDDKLIGSVEQVVPGMTRDLTKWKLEKTAQGFHKWVRKTPRSGKALPSVLEQWNKLDRNFNNNKRLVKGPITDREIQILLRAAPKTQANLNILKRLLTKGQISDKEARKMLLGK
tara:strand:+ start:856 stop:1233 length:378 start_codon:yes stop_codon:yes gene_type:complete